MNTKKKENRIKRCVLLSKYGNITGYWSGVRHDTKAVLYLRRLLSDLRAVERAGWLTDAEKGCMQTESDRRTPTEHVQRTSTKITSVFIRFTHQTSTWFSFPDKLSLVTSFWGTFSAWCKSSSQFLCADIVVSGGVLGFFFSLYSAKRLTVGYTRLVHFHPQHIMLL